MKEIIEKISSYNLFNYLLPGALYASLSERITNFQFIQSDIIIAPFFYYFLGMVISRFGSLIVEPMLRGLSFLMFADYKDFVSVSKTDSKLEILSEANNTYRTFTALFVILGLTKLYELAVKSFSIKDFTTSIFVFALLFVLFISAYKKQTNYITKRIEAEKDAAS